MMKSVINVVKRNVIIACASVLFVASISPVAARGGTALPKEGEIGTTRVTRRTQPPIDVQYVVSGGLAVFEGDIVLGTVEEIERSLRGLVTKSDRRWPDGVIPFRVDLGSFPASPSTIRRGTAAAIQAAIDHWNTNTNLRFVDRTANQSAFVTFQFDPNLPNGVCSSPVGRQGGEQIIRLSMNCGTRTIIHEIGHAVGLWHEQSRSDRDKYVTIKWGNIQISMTHNFNQHVTDGDDSGPYDYDSVMHYCDSLFAIDTSKPTIVAPKPLCRLGGLSPGDIATVNAFYPTWQPNYKIQGQESLTAPALTVYKDQLYMVHQGNDSSNLWMSIYDGEGWAPNVRIPGRKSRNTPALAEFNGRLYMVHVGESSSNLYLSTFDGRRWSSEDRIPGRKSRTTPALAVFNGQLYMVYVGEDSTNLYYSTFDGRNWSRERRIMGQQSKSAPALAIYEGHLHMVHQGESSTNLWHSINDGSGWSPNVQIPNQNSHAAPVLAAFNNQLYMLHLDAKSNAIWSSTYDGSWRPNVPVVGQKSKATPGLMAWNNKLHMVHLGDSSSAMWYSWKPM